MRKTLVLLTFLFVLMVSTEAQVITIGVSPSEFDIYGVGDAKLKINFFNTYGEVDAYYIIKPDDCINPYVVSGFNQNILVPKGTTSNNPIVHDIIISGNFTEKKICYIYVYAYPTNYTNNIGNINIERRVGVRLILGSEKAKTTTTTTKTTTTTTTTTTTKNINNSNIKQTITTIPHQAQDGGGFNSKTTTFKNTPTTISSITTTTTINFDFNSIIEVENRQEKTEAKQTYQNSGGGLFYYLLNTKSGFYLMIGLVFFVVLIIFFIISRKKRNPREDPSFQTDFPQYFYQFLQF